MTDETKPTPRPKPTTIHACLMQAQDEVARSGIAKDSMAKMGGSGAPAVAFRGIEAAMNIMSGILIRAGLTVTPRYSDLRMDTRARAEAGKVTHHAMVLGSFTFTASDGTSVISACYGEAEDTGDKALTKAQSVSFRTALFQTFIAPTMAIDPEDDATINDDGGSTIEGDPDHVPSRQDSVPPPQSGRGELEPYPREKFEANLPVWTEGLKSGALTADKIAAKVNTAAKMNPVQLAKLKSLEKK